MKLGFCFSPPTVTLFDLLSNSVLRLFIIPQQNLAYLTKSFPLFLSWFFGGVFICFHSSQNTEVSHLWYSSYTSPIDCNNFQDSLLYYSLFLLNTFSMGMLFSLMVLITNYFRLSVSWCEIIHKHLN